MACELPGYVGRDVLLEVAYACGDVDPATLTFQPLGSLRTKEFGLTWDTADASSDSSVDNLRENLATFKTLTISGDGVAKRETGGQSPVTILTKHVANPGPAFSNQPVAWVRMTFPDLTFTAYMLITDVSRSATYDDVVTFSFEASAASSNFGLLVEDTPQPIDITSIAVAPTTATVEVDATEQLTATILPSGAVQTVTWSSSAPSIATVSQTGLVTGVAVGTATITARSTYDNTKMATAAITVTV